MGQNCAKDLVVREKQHCLCHEEIGLAEGNHFDALLKCWSRDTVVCKVRCKAAAIAIKLGKSYHQIDLPFHFERGLLCSPYPFWALWLASSCIITGLSEKANF